VALAALAALVALAALAAWLPFVGTGGSGTCTERGASCVLALEWVLQDEPTTVMIWCLEVC